MHFWHHQARIAIDIAVEPVGGCQRIAWLWAAAARAVLIDVDRGTGGCCSRICTGVASIGILVIVVSGSHQAEPGINLVLCTEPSHVKNLAAGVCPVIDNGKCIAADGINARRSWWRRVGIGHPLVASKKSGSTKLIFGKNAPSIVVRCAEDPPRPSYLKVTKRTNGGRFAAFNGCPRKYRLAKRA